MTEIYRVENKKGNGCYRNLSDGLRKALDSVLGDIIFDVLRPLPYHDRGIERTPHNNEICGFENMDQLLKWFDLDDIFELHRFGFEVKKVLVQKVTAIGECQVLAIR